MAISNIQPGKPNRGPVYTVNCPSCGLRKRLNYAIGERDGRKLWLWQFWCRCGHVEIIGTNAELQARIQVNKDVASALHQKSHLNLKSS
jgi:hypothetical protein